MMPRDGKPFLLCAVFCLLCGLVWSIETTSPSDSKWTSSVTGSSLIHDPFLVSRSDPEYLTWSEDGLFKTGTSSFIQFISMFVPAADKIQNKACREHSRLFLQELKNLTDWAVQMLDASAKIPDGFLQGNIRHLGHFDECLELDVSLGEDLNVEDQHITGQYCLANLEVNTMYSSNKHQLDHLLDVMTSNRRFLELTRNRTGAAILPWFALFEWGLCVPSSCTAEDVQTTLNDALRQVLTPLGIQANAEVKQESCYVNSPSKFTETDYVMTFFVVFVVVLIAVSTAYDSITTRRLSNDNSKQGAATRALLAFSFTSNWDRLLNTDSSPGAMDSINGIRFISILWVIMTHKVLTLSKDPVFNKIVIIRSAKDFLKMPLQNSMLNVDTFFLLSGLLKSYHFMREMDEKKFGVLSSYAQRYFRLTPAYAVLIGFYSTFFMHLGSGPAWHRTVQENSEACRENWPLNLLYVNNYIGYDKMCMVQSWYLAADMQLCLLAPLIVYPLWKWPKFGFVQLMLLIVASIIMPFAVTFVNQYPGMYYVGVHDNVLGAYMQYIYMATHNRASPYLVGLALGYLLHRLNTIKLNLSRYVVCCGWAACLAVLYGVMYGPYNLFQLDIPHGNLESSMYGALHRFAWAVAVAWVVFACTKGYGGPINSLLSAKVFQPLSRLSYCMFLTHFAVLLFQSSRIRTAIYMDEYLLMHNFVGDVFVTIVVSAIIHLCFESPFMVLTKIFFGKDFCSKNNTKDNLDGNEPQDVTKVTTDVSEKANDDQQMKSITRKQ